MAFRSFRASAFEGVRSPVGISGRSGETASSLALHSTTLFDASPIWLCKMGGGVRPTLCDTEGDMVRARMHVLKVQVPFLFR